VGNSRHELEKGKPQKAAVKRSRKRSVRHTVWQRRRQDSCGQVRQEKKVVKSEFGSAEREDAACGHDETLEAKGKTRKNEKNKVRRTNGQSPGGGVKKWDDEPGAAGRNAGCMGWMIQQWGEGVRRLILQTKVGRQQRSRRKEGSSCGRGSKDARCWGGNPVYIQGHRDDANTVQKSGCRSEPVIAPWGGLTKWAVNKTNSAAREWGPDA